MNATSFVEQCVSIDLEVNPDQGRILAIGAVCEGVESRSFRRRGNMGKSLSGLDQFAANAKYLLGHNFIKFDLPHLHAANPNLRLLKKPALDTLWLGPLAYPRNPYHHLVKHYQDPQLVGNQRNNPELDARLTIQVLKDQIQEFRKADSNLLLLWHWLCAARNEFAAFDVFFVSLRDAPKPSFEEFHHELHEVFGKLVCPSNLTRTLDKIAGYEWELAFALSWISVAGGNSVMPPWVTHQFPKARSIVRFLRSTKCDTHSCPWCSQTHDPKRELKHWFGFESYRPKPATKSGQSMQEAIVASNMKGEHVIGILPTGTGKSLCYQIPALNRFENTGVLTVVISPLVALMADQVTGLLGHGIDSCVAINGLLSYVERAAALDKVRLGAASILLISPEQLRSKSVVRAIEQREIGGWVIDEAHCLSKWGHDFRTDYRYIPKFIKVKADGDRIPPIMCLTATAKPDVVQEIRELFQEKVGIELQLFDGGAKRHNLSYEVLPIEKPQKYPTISEILKNGLSGEESSGAIVYCSTRKETEELALFLREHGLTAAHFHAGREPESKKDIQSRFLSGDLRVVVATNAFGMGIDKPDVRLVVHADIPGSLESYFQEAGRAGRDGDAAKCVMLYSNDDVEWQFKLAARSKIAEQEIRGILKALRKIDAKGNPDGTVVASSGEVLIAETEGEFQRDSTTDVTRVQTAVAWLEESRLLERTENQVRVFPASLIVKSVEEAKQKLDITSLQEPYKAKLVKIVETLITSDSDDGISTDEIMGLTGMSPERVRKALQDLELLQLVRNDVVLTAFVHSGVANASPKRFAAAEELEKALIAQLREAAPDMSVGDSHILHLAVASHTLRNAGVSDPIPTRVWLALSGIANDGDSENEVRSLSVQRRAHESVDVTLQREWNALEKTASIRREAAGLLLDHLVNLVPDGARGKDLLVETTLGDIYGVLQKDTLMRNQVDNVHRLADRALMWLHEHEIIRLNHGLTVFRRAMTIKLEPDKRDFVNEDFKPLEFHYEGQTLQIHVMAEYAKIAIDEPRRANELADEYFELKRDEFLNRWLKGKLREINRETTPDSWKSIVEDLGNRNQQDIVTDSRVQTNVLVLAGPGSGKTRVLVHRIAYLVRVKREKPRSILALAYNRHAAVEIRSRLRILIGDDAKGVMVLTCHALAMRIAGYSFANQADSPDDATFHNVLKEATRLLQGEGLPAEDATDQRERLLRGFRWILTDEYQDIGPDEYDLISALAGRTNPDADGKLTLFAVGDDDQNIYSFRGASIEYIRRFEEDYKAKSAYLPENYRSTNNIIKASNAVIERAVDRLKAKQPLRIDHARDDDPDGGEWESLDPVARGRTQLISAPNELSQAQIAVAELQRLRNLAPAHFDWSRSAIVARQWDFLNPVRAICEADSIPVQIATDDLPPLWQLRETQNLLRFVEETDKTTIRATDLIDWVRKQPQNSWFEMLMEAIEEYETETDGQDSPIPMFKEWLAETLRDFRGKQQGLLLLSAHKAKGLEFDHVVILDGGWDDQRAHTDDSRRLYYVAMTRAKHTLTLMQLPDQRSYGNELRSKGLTMSRTYPKLEPPASEIRLEYQQLTPADVDLSFAGRFSPTHPIHQAISNLNPGDSLVQLTSEPNDQHKSDVLCDDSRNEVVRLAKRYRWPSGMRLKEASVFAVLERDKTQSDPNYTEYLKNERWEVILPRFVFEPLSI